MIITQSPASDRRLSGPQHCALRDAWEFAAARQLIASDWCAGVQNHPERSRPYSSLFKAFVGACG